MDSTRLEVYRKKLLELQASIREEIDHPPEEVSTVELNGSMGRVSRGDAMQGQQMALEMQRRGQERLRRIDSALIRREKGTFGSCCRCRNPIQEARLEAFPDAVLCVRCAA